MYIISVIKMRKDIIVVMIINMNVEVDDFGGFEVDIGL